MCWQEVRRSLRCSPADSLELQISLIFFFVCCKKFMNLYQNYNLLDRISLILPNDRHQSLLQRRRITATFKTFVCHNFRGQIEKTEKLDWKHIPMLCLLCLYLIHRGGFCKGNRTPYHASPPCVLPQWTVPSLPSGYVREIHVNVASYSNQASFHCSCRWRNQNVAVILLPLTKQL